MSEYIERIVKKCLALPNGFEAEVCWKDGKLSFSEPLTGNTWTEDPTKIGRIESMSIDDFEGFHVREDGQVEIEDEDSKVKGEYYDNIEIISREEAIERIVQICEDDNVFDEIMDEITK